MNLKDKYPKAWEDLEKWYDKQTYIAYGIISLGVFKELPFEMQLGVYLKYLEEKFKGKVTPVGGYILNGHAVIEQLQAIIEDSFKIREKELTTKQK